MIRENDTYKLMGFAKSHVAGKKYDAILWNKRAGRERRVPFGDAHYEHYRDSTGVGLWSHRDHGDVGRRANYRRRHGGEGDRSNFPNSGYWAYHCLW